MGKSVNERELDILAFWDKDKTFEKSLERTKGNEEYVFYDGPPFATGLPHYGHLLGSIIKDIYGRFWTMKGKYVRRVWGWDCHGLPIENIAEKALGINSKDEIEKMGVGKFNAHCRSTVLSFTDEWKKMIRRVGRWVDMDDCYRTMDVEYTESVWWAFKQMYEKGFIYEGERVLPFCPRCSTPLAKAEIAMDNSYKPVKDLSVVAKFRMRNAPVEGNVFALAWTTTPWTLPSNLALMVHPDLDYSFVKDLSDSNVYVLASSLISSFYKDEGEYEVVKVVKGKELQGVSYEPLFDFFSDTRNAFKFLLADFVSSEEGTGIVHTAMAFGEDDYRVCKEYDIEMVQPVDENGCFTNEVGQFSGMYVHDANLEIVKYLKSNDLAVMSRKIEHEYPFCYRCDTKLIYRAIPAWFVDIAKIKPRLLELNKGINWHPDFLGGGRVHNSIEMAPNWNISRNRYWATALPVWKSEDGEVLVIGSIDELKTYAKHMPKGEVDLHKDFVDGIVLEKDGKEYRRVPEVVDCWFESGSMPFAQYHYPFENEQHFLKSLPADFVAEYIGQVRTWFYYMSVMSAILYDTIPFKHVVTTGTIMAEDGSKMSKSKQNFEDPSVLIEKYGVDALRFYLATSSVMNAENVNFSEKQLDEIYKKVVLMLYNVLNFYELYDDLENVDLNPVHEMDVWMLSRLEEFSCDVEEYLNAYNTVKLGGVVRDFVEDLSTWYVRVSRDRFNEGDVQVKAVLRTVLLRVSNLLAPLLPFVCEDIFRTIDLSGESVHLSSWESGDDSSIDIEMNERMKLVREVVSLGLRQRDSAGIGLRWPLGQVTIRTDTGFGLEKFIDIISDQLNVKNVIFDTSTDSELVVELDVTQTDELLCEGYVREFIRKVQAARKEKDLVKDNRIVLYVRGDLEEYVGQYRDLIISAVGAEDVLCGKIPDDLLFSGEGKIKDVEFIYGFSVS